MNVVVVKDWLDITALWAQILGATFTTIGVLGALWYSTHEYRTRRGEQARLVLVESLTTHSDVLVRVTNHSAKFILDVEIATPKDPDPSVTLTLPPKKEKGLQPRRQTQFTVLHPEKSEQVTFMRTRNSAKRPKNSDQPAACHVTFTDGNGRRWSMTDTGKLKKSASK
ncbi:hypothetical protein ACFYVD_10505 [Rhodococcus pyridinivorans]|uniref:hypothetical protein n=1 Tax=Rhodococcus pyridinivorans TaxID=103816 RepID=UPI00369076DA